MRTTVSIDDGLLAEAKLAAARSGRTLGQVIEDCLRAGLAPRPATRPRVHLPTDTPTRHGGLQPGVDLDDSAALLDLLEADDPPL